MLTIYTNHPGGNLVHRYKSIENVHRDVPCLHPKIWHNLGTTVLRGEKIGNNGDEKWDGGGGGANEVYNYGLGENGK